MCLKWRVYIYICQGRWVEGRGACWFFFFFFWVQELCESWGGCPGLPVCNSLYDLCRRKAILNLTWSSSLLLSIGCPLIDEYSTNLLLCAKTATTQPLLSTWLNPWRFTNQPTSCTLLLILIFLVFSVCAHTLTWSEIFFLCCTVCLEQSFFVVAKFEHQTHSHLSKHLWNLTSSSCPIDCVCVCIHMPCYYSFLRLYLWWGLCMYLWSSLCTFCLLKCQLKIIVDNSDLCHCVCVMSSKCWLTSFICWFSIMYIILSKEWNIEWFCLWHKAVVVTVLDAVFKRSLIQCLMVTCIELDMVHTGYSDHDWFSGWQWCSEKCFLHFKSESTESFCFLADWGFCAMIQASTSSLILMACMHGPMEREASSQCSCTWMRWDFLLLNRCFKRTVADALFSF